MKTLIISLNSKYIHSSLAPWYLKAACGDHCGEIKVMEFTINDNPDSLLGSIYSEKADIAAFSCYIWNMAFVTKVIEGLKKVSPAIKVILGGPEVSFDSVDLVKGNPSVDFIVTGEGENAFRLLLGHLNGNAVKLEEIEGLTYRKENTVLYDNVYPLIANLDTIPSPYTDEMIASLGNRIVYYESSRGCPFSCSYCLSSTFSGVRLFSMERAKADLTKLMKAGVRQVKFVDRTFNCNRERAKEIFNFIIENAAEINFHFEVAADLFDDDMLDILSKAPQGLIQFEIGVQTTNSYTLEAINRKTDLSKVFGYAGRLKRMGNIHIHLDLIAGLPYENYNSFISSFNEVYSLAPNQLQLGFLKLLKGSRIRNEEELHEYVYRSYPPYEVLKNKYITYDEILGLKGIEELVERYYNSGKFKSSLDFIMQNYKTAFDFYHEFYCFNLSKGCLNRPLASRELYAVIVEFIETRNPEIKDVIMELLKFDFLTSDNTGNLPLPIRRNITEGFKDRCFDFLRVESNIEKYIPEFRGIPSKEIFKQLHFEAFSYNPVGDSPGKEEAFLLFNYAKRNKVSGLYEYKKIETDDF